MLENSIHTVNKNVSSPFLTQLHNIFYCVGRSSWLLKCQNFLQRGSSSLSFLHNYFNESIKLISGLYLVKVLHTLAKFFP